MALMKRDRNDEGVQTRIDCLLGEDASLTGDMCFKGGLRIDGRLEGNLSVQPGETGTLMVGAKGKVGGHVDVTHAVLSGEVSGTVRTSGLLELHATAVVRGDVVYGTIRMEAGAVIEGQLQPLSRLQAVAPPEAARLSAVS